MTPTPANPSPATSSPSVASRAVASPTLAAFVHELARYRGLAEGAARQLEFAELRVALDPEANSIAVIMKHVAGNLRSRWTDPFGSDGEKVWRDRDGEFVDDFEGEAALWAWWGRGWAAAEGALAAMDDSMLGRTLAIRGEAHTLAAALARSATHTSYHCGQIVLIARVLASRAGRPWRTLTVPRGGSASHNASMGYDPRR